MNTSNNGTAAYVRNLTKVYKGGVRALDNISFEVLEREIFGILGPNGAGKSTLMKILSTLISSTNGEVSIFSEPRPAADPRIRSIIGYLPQDISSDSTLTGYENLLLSARLHGLWGSEMKKRIDEILKMMQLTAAKDRLTSTYSGGMIRKLELAQALVHTPKIILMDEPTVGLDPVARDSLIDEIRKLRERMGVTVILTTHYMEEADALCDRVAIMNRGRIAAIDSPQRLKARVGKAVVTFEIGGSKRPRIKGMHFKNGVATVASSTPDADMPRYMKMLTSMGITVKSARAKEATLDDAFLKFTGGKLEDDVTTGWRDTKKARRVMRRVA